MIDFYKKNRNLYAFVQKQAGEILNVTEKNEDGLLDIFYKLISFEPFYEYLSADLQENILKSPYIEVNILLFKDLNAESISNVTATCITSQAEIYPDEMEEFVDLLSHIKIGERVKEKVIDGLSPQYFIIEYKDGTTQRIGMHGGIITIDNQKYYTEYTSCQELSRFYEKIMKRAKTV